MIQVVNGFSDLMKIILNREFFFLPIFQDELTAMVGKKCSAPHTHAWGAKAYHNAMICGLDDINEYDEEDIELDKVKVKILFTNPTHREMLPCAYYLDGECRFNADKCRCVIFPKLFAFLYKPFFFVDFHMVNLYHTQN